MQTITARSPRIVSFIVAAVVLTAVLVLGAFHYAQGGSAAPAKATPAHVAPASAAGQTAASIYTCRLRRPC